MSWLIFLILLTIQGDKPAPVSGMPAATGVYYRQNEARWLQLETAALADMKGKGMGGFLETDGYMNLNVRVTYLGAQSKIQIPEALPTLYVRGAGSPKDAMIIHLTRGKDIRTVQTDSAHANVDNRAGFRKEEIQTVTVTVYADNSFSVTPERELRPGEYALVFGFANAAYDFSITRGSK